MNWKHSAIIGSGIYLPETIVTSVELEKTLGLEEGFIEKRTGIKERRLSQDHESVVDMAVEAASAAVQDAGVRKIDQIIVCRDLIMTRRAHSIALPILGKLEQAGVCIDGTFSIDIANYCPSFIHALHWAEMTIGYGETDNVLIVASTDYRDVINTSKEFNDSFPEKFYRNEFVQQYSLGTQGYFQAPRLNAFLWGCGAAAIVVGKTDAWDSPSFPVIGGYHARGSKAARHDCYGVGETPQAEGFSSLDGQTIYKFAIEEVPKFLEEYLDYHDIGWPQIDFLIPHQPNPRILKDLAKRLRIPESKVLMSCDTLGNMIGASIPATYHLNRMNGKLQTGSRILLCSFGDSYLTVAAMMIHSH